MVKILIAIIAIIGFGAIYSINKLKKFVKAHSKFN